MWRATIDPARIGEYERFAAERSVPMFPAHEGFLGVLFLSDGAARVVCTFWSSISDVEALERSARYVATVKAIEETGFVVVTAGTEGL